MPLFALRSRRDWGIGELGDLPQLVAWTAGAGHRLLQLLPIFEVAAGERSPYAALSAFALDPIYLSLGAVEDFVAAGGEAALAPEDHRLLEATRTAAGIDYERMRQVKQRALGLAFERFVAGEWRGRSARAADLERFCAAEREWLEDYARVRTGDGRPDGILFHQYVQWLVAGQWSVAHRAARAAGVRLVGDFPFTVAATSADVRISPEAFDLTATLGAPPDAFSADGQRWGLPVCRWDAGGAPWLAARVRRAAALFDGIRIDHVVGFYRQYVFPAAGIPGFVPADEPAQLALGERLLGAVRAAAGTMELVGEDLGVVPDFVRASLARLDVPGYRVLRWETEASRFRDPVTYPARSVATSGTHDTSALATWWETELDDAGRRALAQVPAFAALREAGPTWTAAVHDALLEGLYAAGSDDVVLPVVDAVGGRERINLPASVSEENWSYRLPWTVEELAGGAGAALRDHLHALAARHGRR